MMVTLTSLKSERPVDALHENEYYWLPAHKPPQPVEQLSVPVMHWKYSNVYIAANFPYKEGGKTT